MDHEDPRIELLIALTGVICIFVLIVLLAFEVVSQGAVVVPSRTIHVLLGLAGALLGLKTVIPSHTSDDHRRGDGGKILPTTDIGENSDSDRTVTDGRDVPSSMTDGTDDTDGDASEEN